MSALQTTSRTISLLVSRPQRALLMLRIAGWVAVLSILVRATSLPRALKMISRPIAPKSPRLATKQAELVTAIDALLALNFFVFKPVCWKRAALLHRYLAAQGTATEIVFGVRKESNDVLSGHAWLEAAGEPILEKEVPAYTRTYIFTRDQIAGLPKETINWDTA